MTAGKVYRLTREEIEEQEDHAIVLRQVFMESNLLLILKKARAEIEAMEFPLNWPNKFYDQAGTLQALDDLMPTQTVKDMELEAEVRRAEIRAAERNGQ